MSNLQVKLTEFSDIIDSYTADFVGRGWLAQQVDDLLAAPNYRIVVITGGAGVGKSAFMADLAATHLQWPRYFIRRDSWQLLRPGDAKTFLLTVGGQLASLYPQLFKPENLEIIVHQRIRNLGADARATGVQIEELHASPFYRVAIEVEQEIDRVAGKATGLEIGRLVSDPRNLGMQDLLYMGLIDPAWLLFKDDPETQIVVLVDALDELRFKPVEGKSVLDALCELPVDTNGTGVKPQQHPNQKLTGIPPNIRFVVTSRDEKMLDQLLKRDDVKELPLEMEGENNKQDLCIYLQDNMPQNGLEQALAQAASTTDQFKDDLLRKANGNFLYLRSILNALEEALADQEKSNLLPSLLQIDSLPDDLDRLYDHFIDAIVTQVISPQFGEMAWRQYLRPLLGILAVAQEPLNIDQLQDFTALDPEDISDLLRELRQFIKPVGSQPLFHIYHTSFAEYLLNTKNNQDYQINGAKWHKQVVAAYRAEAVSWDQVDWKKADLYGLRYLFSHLYTLHDDHPFQDQLHELLQTDSYISERLERVGLPGPLLADLRIALDLALLGNDLAQAWRHMTTNRRVQHDERDFDRVKKAVGEGDFEAAMDRTLLHAYLPNSQALERLWIAWKAVTAGKEEMGRNAVRQALSVLPPRGFVDAAVAKMDGTASSVVGDAIQESIVRFLVRIALQGKPDWIQPVASKWLGSQDQLFSEYFSQPLDQWGDIFNASGMETPIDDVLNELKGRGGLDANINFRSANNFFQEYVAAALFNFRMDHRWLNRVDLAVKHLSLDDYPIYREMALAWIISTALAHPNVESAQTAVALALEGIFKPGEIGFLGDTVAAVMDGYLHGGGPVTNAAELLYYLDQWEVATQQEVYLSIGAKPEDLVAWRQQTGLPTDPWAHALRRLSAVAAVLKRHGQDEEARNLLVQAGSIGYDNSYAGYRSLARLSLACRWLEWGELNQVREQVDGACQDAEHMLDPVLRQERLYLVDLMEDWLAAFTAEEMDKEDESILEKVRASTGMERAVFIEFLSSIWAENPDRLIKLLPLALDDVTATDAVFSRILGSLQPAPEQFAALQEILRVDMPEL